MKKLILLVLPFLLFISCSKNDSEPIINNALFDSKWQTEDIVALVIYGGDCYQVIHFIDNDKFEIYSTRDGQIKAHDYEGRYSIKDKVVTITYRDGTSNKDAITKFDMIDPGTLVKNPSGTFYDVYIRQ